MKQLKSLWLGSLLLLGASLILLFSDKNLTTSSSRSNRMPRVAMFQYSSQPLLERTIKGAVVGLAEKGFVDGESAKIDYYNAEADMSMSNTIAQKMVAGGYDLIISASTLALQTVANANKDGKVKHFFAAVTDPYGAGVGISGEKPDEHPPWLAGIGTFQPVEQVFKLAHQLNPSLKRVGVVWNPAETCSEACVKKARKICARLGIELLEVHVENANGVQEATNAVLNKGAQALYVGGDNTVTIGLDALVKAANKHGAMVFTNGPMDVKRGVGLAIGADYYQVGLIGGELAGDILRSLPPSDVAIKNVVPEQLAINEQAFKKMAESGWSLPLELIQEAAVIVKEDGSLEQTKTDTPMMPPANKHYKVGLVYFGPDASTERAIEGFKSSLRSRGFISGRNLDLIIRDAQGEIANITPILKSFETEKVDLIVPMTTPCLTASCVAVKNIPVVFNCVYDPIAAGAGKNLKDHLPNVTGIGSYPPISRMPGLIKTLLPRATSVATVYNASEANSSKAVKSAQPLFEKSGMTLTAATASNSNEVYQALDTLLSRSPDAVWITGDNTVFQAFDAVAKLCGKHKKPLIINDTEFVGRGAVLGCGVSFYQVGEAGGNMVADALLGVSTKTTPIQDLKTCQIALNFDTAKRLGIHFDTKMLQDASLYFNVAARFGNRPAKVALIKIADNPLLDRAVNGLTTGLKDAGLVEGKDYILDSYGAQGELHRIPMLINAVRQKRYDLVLTCGTPVMINAVQKIKETPLVFFVASDPLKTGVRSPGESQGNITGVHDDPPVRQLIDIARKRIPDLRRIGTIYDPAQVNARISVDKLREVCGDLNLKLEERPVSAISELSDATATLAVEKVDLIVISADNLTCSGFPAIYKIAKKSEIPIYATEPDLFDQGASVCIGDDLFEWGRQTGELAAKVLAGVPPVVLPYEKTKVQRTFMTDENKSTAAFSIYNKPVRIGVVCYSMSTTYEEATSGLKDGFKKLGLVEGKDIKVTLKNALGDIPTLTSIAKALKDDTDIFVPMSTPALQATVRQIKNKPIVFSVVSNPVVAGAGKSDTDHLPNVTGVIATACYDKIADILAECMPRAKRIGTLFCPSEVNSVYAKDLLAKELKRHGIELVGVAVNTPTDMMDASLALCEKQIDAVCQIPDNLSSANYAPIIKATEKSNIPMFSCVSSHPREGGTIAIAKDYYTMGFEAAELVDQVIKGESPKVIPFKNSLNPTIVINRRRAAHFGLKIPENIQKRAEFVD